MAFAVLLILSLTTFVVQEQKAASIATNQLKARQNAMFGLQVALGRLQVAMGPDTRISAQAGLFDDIPDIPGSPLSIENSNWLGVWDSREINSLSDQALWDELEADDKLNEAIVWLVSGDLDRIDPLTAILNDSDSVLVEPANDDFPLEVDTYALKEAILGGPSNLESGSFAYIIDDEAQKANLSVSDPEAGTSNQIEARERLSVIRQHYPWIITETPSPVPELSQKIHSFESVQNFDGADRISKKDFTASSVGLLTDSAKGGLKRDLTLAFRPTAVTDIPVEFQIDPTDEESGRYLYYFPNTELADSSSPVGFTSGLPRDLLSGRQAAGALQGPRWDMLHDYFQLGNRLNIAANGVADQHTTTEDGVRNDNKDGGNLEFFAHDIQTIGHGNDRERNYLFPHEEQILGTAIDDSFRNPYTPQSDDIVRGALSPVLTEIRLHVTIDFNSNNQPVIRIHPLVEFVNPYDFPIDAAGYRISIMRLSMLMDFRFEAIDTSTGDVSGEVTWSSDGWIGTGEPSLLPRYVGALASERASLNMYLDVENAGVFAPGEVKSFNALGKRIVSGSTIDFRTRMTAGSDWQNNYLELPTHPYSLSNNTPEYDFSTVWPSDSNSYNTFSANLSFLPVRRDGANTFLDDSIDIRIRKLPSSPANRIQQTQQGVIRFGNDLMQNSTGINNNLNGGYSWGAVFTKSADESWVDVFDDPGTAIIVQAERISADTDLTNPAEYVARSNPRSILFSDSHGFSGSKTTGSTGWRLGLYENDGALQLSGFWGSSNGVGGDGAVLFSAPRASLEPLSIGNLRHANLGMYPSDPAYLVGNSERPTNNLAFDKLLDYFRVDAAGESATFNGAIDFSNTIDESFTYRRADFALDSGYLLNRSLWDRYFFSTKPVIWAAGEAMSNWPNTRFIEMQNQEPSASVTDFDRYDRIASRLAVEGAFNINSISEKAWAALIAGNTNIQLPNGDIADGVVFPRTTYLSGSSSDPFKGYAVFDSDAIYQDGQETTPGIDSLSEAIVEEIKKRGPFLSLAHFVNRLLVADSRGELGALAAAIEASGINSGLVSGIPGSLAQHDLLEPLAATLSARGDTFRIKVVGYSNNPVTGELLAQASCEAIVQRCPDYVDSNQSAEVLPNDLNPTNASFGRRFRIVNFTWLN